eukprot:755079-Hanusia_phi.AAC.2
MLGRENGAEQVEIKKTERKQRTVRPGGGKLTTVLSSCTISTRDWKLIVPVASRYKVTSAAAAAAAAAWRGRHLDELLLQQVDQLGDADAGGGAAASVDKVHVDPSRARVRRCALSRHSQQPHRLLHVDGLHLLGQAHLGVRLGQADDGLELTGGGGDCVPAGRHAPHLHVAVDERRLGVVVEHRMALVPCVRDKLCELLEGEDRLGEARRILEVEGDQVLCQPPVRRRVGLIQDEVDQVEPRQQRGRKLRVVSALDRVGGGENGGPGVEAANDAGLSHRDADPSVAQNQGSALQHNVLRLRILLHVGCQANRRAALPRRVDAPGGNLVHVLQELGLGHAGIPDQEDVDISAEAAGGGALGGLVAPAEELAEKALLDVIHLVDTRSKGVDELLIDVGIGRKLQCSFFLKEGDQSAAGWEERGRSRDRRAGSQGEGEETRSLLVARSPSQGDSPPASRPRRRRSHPSSTSPSS